MFRNSALPTSRGEFPQAYARGGCCCRRGHDGDSAMTSGRGRQVTRRDRNRKVAACVRLRSKSSQEFWPIACVEGLRAWASNYVARVAIRSSSRGAANGSAAVASRGCHLALLVIATSGHDKAEFPPAARAALSVKPPPPEEGPASVTIGCVGDTVLGSRHGNPPNGGRDLLTGFRRLCARRT